MDPRTLFALLAAAVLCVGCPVEDDDDTGDDDVTGDDDDVTGDDDDDVTGDDDDDAACEVAPPGYAGENGFHFVLDDGTDVTVENPTYENMISSISSGLFVSTDNGSPPQTPTVGEDYIWINLQASPHTTVVAGAQALQPTPDGGPALTFNVIPDFPDGMNDQRIYAVNASFGVSQGTLTCDQAPAAGSPFHCTYEAVLVWAEHDEISGELYLAGCTGVSGAFTTQLVSSG